MHIEVFSAWTKRKHRARQLRRQPPAAARAKVQMRGTQQRHEHTAALRKWNVYMRQRHPRDQKRLRTLLDQKPTQTEIRNRKSETENQKSKIKKQTMATN